MVNIMDGYSMESHGSGSAGDRNHHNVPVSAASPLPSPPLIVGNGNGSSAGRRSTSRDRNPDDSGSEASRMLEAALQHMDGIISGAASSRSTSSQDGSSSTVSPRTNVLAAAQTLAMILQQSGNQAPSPDPLTAGLINTWLETHLPRQDTDERLRRLQTDKESLALQVQVLTEQVATQGEKITDMERTIADKSQLLHNTEDLLQREMLSRSSLETQKLELMSAMSELKLQQAALERENLELRSSHLNNNGGVLPPRRPPVPARALSAAPLLHGSHGSLQHQPPTSASATNVAQSGTPKTPPSTFRRQVDLHYSSLPRQAFPTAVHIQSNGIAVSNPSVAMPADHQTSDNSTSSQEQANSSSDTNANPTAGAMASGPSAKQRNVAFAETEKIIEDSGDGHQQRSFTPQPSPSPSMAAKAKGLRGIFGKIKRSNSGNLEDLSPDAEFRRGGIRATAGARLGWNRNGSGSMAASNGGQQPSLQQLADRPFAEWDVDGVCAWLAELGLDCYEAEARRWLRDGGAAELCQASAVDIEKELGLKSPLHRKKITLALADVSGSPQDELLISAGKLDPDWILRWLDDVGLPQHKDAFGAARLDGRMLHRLTMDDLLALHVTSSLHAASLRRGIQVMRANQWNPECLIRRSTTVVGVPDDEQPQQPEPFDKQVHLWTAHRVMEWLRSVDLAEYAPNLRGAGVHGALMMFDARFTAELLADLLCIQPAKTLLRRHLGTHFAELLGRDVIQAKRDAETTLGFQPLTLTAKLKTPKKSQFSLKRKKSTKGGDEWSDFVCPMGQSDDESAGTGLRNRVRGCLSSNTSE